MKVYYGYECYYDYCDVWETVNKVFDDEAKALIWKEEFQSTETEWRYYRGVEVE
jgi:hypothetical protein